MKNLEYRLRKFKDQLPNMLEDIVRSKEDVIVSAIANDQLNHRGVTGFDVKIMSYAPYAPRTIRKKQRKGQPTTRVTLRDTGKFHESFYLAFDEDGFYVTSNDDKAVYLIEKYGDEIFRIDDSNFNRILRVHIRRELTKRLEQTVAGA